MQHPGKVSQDLSYRFLWAILLTMVVFVFELIGGFWTGSLALLSDSAHVFMDAFALVLSFFAMQLACQPVTDRKTYGLHRTEVFAALLNGSTLFLVSLWIFWEALRRITGPAEIKSTEMLLIAAVGLIINLIVAGFLREGSHDDLNVKSAYLHVVADALSSVGVIVGAVIIYTTKWVMVDPIISIIIGLVILGSSLKVIRHSTNLLMEGVPEHIDTQKVIKAIEAVPGIAEVRDIHIWGICSNICALSAHIKVKSESVADCQDMIKQINHILLPLGIQHSTLQLDTGGKQTICTDGNNICQGGAT